MDHHPERAARLSDVNACSEKIAEDPLDRLKQRASSPIARTIL